MSAEGFSALLPFTQWKFPEEVTILLGSLTLGQAPGSEGTAAMFLVTGACRRTSIKRCVGLSSPKEGFLIKDAIKQAIWVSMFVFGREEACLETWERGSALYTTTEGSLAVGGQLPSGSRWGFSRHRNVSRCHMCLWKQRPNLWGTVGNTVAFEPWEPWPRLRRHKTIPCLPLPRTSPLPLATPHPRMSFCKQKPIRQDWCLRRQLAGIRGKEVNQTHEPLCLDARVEGHRLGQKPQHGLSQSPFSSVACLPSIRADLYSLGLALGEADNSFVCSDGHFCLLWRYM